MPFESLNPKRQFSVNDEICTVCISVVDSVHVELCQYSLLRKDIKHYHTSGFFLGSIRCLRFYFFSSFCVCLKCSRVGVNWLITCIWFVIPKVPLVERISCSKKCLSNARILSISQRKECDRLSDRASERCQWTFDKYAFADHFYITLGPFFSLSFVLYFKFLASQHTFFLWMNLIELL